MPLDNTASLQDIITSLQNMEGINAKADLASVVGSPATADDSMAMISNTIQQAKNDLAVKTGQVNNAPLQSLIDNLVVGKKWASGVQAGVGGYIAITGLDFKPRTIVLQGHANSVTLYFADFSTTNYVRVVSSSNARNEIIDGVNSYVVDGGFRLMVTDTRDYNWVAYE